MVLSESIPSLPLLLDLQSISAFGVRGTRKLSALRGVMGGELDAELEEPRRFSVGGGSCNRLSEDRVSDATIRDTETDVVAGVSAGRRPLEYRRGELGWLLYSGSAGFRLGDECEEPSPLRRSMDTVDALCRLLSMVGELGSEDETPVELEFLEPLLEPGVTEPCLPLPLGTTVIGFVPGLGTAVDRATLFPLREADREGDLKPTGD